MPPRAPPSPYRATFAHTDNKPEALCKLFQPARRIGHGPARPLVLSVCTHKRRGVQPHIGIGQAAPGGVTPLSQQILVPVKQMLRNQFEHLRGGGGEGRTSLSETSS